MGAMLLSCSTSALAQDGTQADIAAVKNLIQSKPADMVKAMKPFYSKNKKNAENLVAFGRAFYEAKDTANARVAANNALNASKRQYSPAYVLLGDIAAMGDDGGEAAAMYEQAIYYDKTNPDPYRKYALVYRKIDPDGAVAKLEQLRSEVPSYPVDALKAHIYYLSLKYGPAIETYAKVPTSQMTRSDFIEYANACFVLQQYEQGYNAAKAGLAKEPNNGTLTRLAMFCANKMKKYDEAVKTSVAENADCAFGTYLLQQYGYNFEAEELAAILDKYLQADPANETALRLKEQNDKVLATSVGKKFIDFEMANMAGGTSKLSDFVNQNKVTLVDFWASWCGPCRQEMPNVKAAYEKFGAKGFGIVGVSLDRDEESWKKGVADLGMAWPQISDLKYWDCEGAALYGVRAIPATVLIGQDGTIIARNLRGEKLAEKLAEVLQ